MTQPNPTLGFVGLGAMGAPMCANLLAKSGCRVVCHDLAPQAMQALAARGAVAAQTLDALAYQAGVVFLCLASPAAAEHVVDGLIAAWDGRADRTVACTVVDMGTTPLQTTRRMAARLAAAGNRFVDAPVARMVQAAVDGTLSIMVGAEAEDLAALMPWLRCMGTDVTHCGAVGAGQVVKILHNTVLIETVHALAEAVAVARGHGVDAAVLLDAIELGSADCRAARVQGREALLPRHYPEGKFPTHYALKDVGAARELAALAGLDTALADTTHAALQRTVAAGLGSRYYPALYEVIAHHPAAAAAA